MSEDLFLALMISMPVLLVSHLVAWLNGGNTARRWMEHQAIANGAATYTHDHQGDTEFTWVAVIPTPERTPSHGQ